VAVDSLILLVVALAWIAGAVVVVTLCHMAARGDAQTYERDYGPIWIRRTECPRDGDRPTGPQ
jgi:hypothetical protein